jgi:hypothetical protein
MSKLEYLEPLKPLDTLHALKRPDSKDPKSIALYPKDSDFFKPINVFGPPDPKLSHDNPKVNIETSAPDLRTLRVQDSMCLRILRVQKPENVKFKSPYNQKPKYIQNVNSKLMNPNYYKTRDIHASYNSLMNNLYPKETVSCDEDLSQTEGLNTVSLELVQNDVVVEDPVNVNHERSALDVPRTEGLKKSIPEKQKRLEASKDLQNYLDSLEAVESYTSNAMSVNPKNHELEEDLEEKFFWEQSIEIIQDPNLTKKQCMVWWEGDTISYGKFRQNPDNIIFVVGEDAYGYSKQDLFKEYQETMKKKNKGLDRSIYFDLNLNWEDNETLWIPMNQILRVLEYSHPVYEIQKMKYSMHVWNLVPVKLK